MSQQTPQNRVLFPRTLAMSMVGGFVAFMVLITLFLAMGVSLLLTVSNPATASAATNSTLNFQARLEGSAGNIAPDGYYNVEFKIYNSSTVVPTPDAGACTRNGGTAEPTCLWTERYYDSNGVTAGNDNRVQVRNGYLSVNLGSQTAFPSTINWDQDLWVTLNIGGTTQTATPTWDGEMTPRLKLTGVPYAFKAGQLATFNATSGFTSTLSLLQPTVGNQVFQVANQGAAGTYTLCIQSSTACGFAAATGGTGYIQNQNSGVQTTSNFWISGSGRADTALQAPLIDTATATTLNIGTTNATSIALNKDVSVAAGKAITLVGGITSTRPASPAEGMLYYDTTTDQLLVYANGKWQADRSTSTKIVGTSASGGTSSAVASLAPEGADYVNTSTTSAQTTIQSALTAVGNAGGGTVYLMEGTYIIDGGISIPSNVTLMGSGATTIIKLKNAANIAVPMIGQVNWATDKSIGIKNLKLDGNKSTQSSGESAINLANNSGTSAGFTVEGVTIVDPFLYGIYAEGSNNLIQNNTIVTPGFRALYLFTFTNSVISGNYITGAGDYGIRLSTGATNNVLSGNTVLSTTGTGIGISVADSNNTITGNQVSSNGAYGVEIAGGLLNTISGNTITSNATRGISLTAGAETNTVNGNTLSNNGGTTTNNAIYLAGSSDSNNITSNHISDSSCTTNCYAINVSSSAIDATYLADNFIGPNETINDLGNGTIYANQLDGSGNLLSRSIGGGSSFGKTTAGTTLDIQGSLRTGPLPTPASPTLAVVGTTGSTVRRYQITALDGFGETLPSTIVEVTNANATLSAGNRVNLTWALVGGAVSYKIYRCTGSGCTPALLTTVTGNNWTYQDTANGSPAGILPTINTTGGAYVGGNVTLQAATNSAGALAVNNSSSQLILGVNTSTNTVNLGGFATPGTPSTSTSTSGGTLAAGTYYYKVTALDSYGNETLPSAEASRTTTGSTSTVTVSWTAVPGAVTYRVYRGTTSGGQSVYYTSATNSYIDTGSASTAGTVPIANSAAAVHANSTGLTIQPATNSTSTFQVQTADGSNVFTIDTTNEAVTTKELIVGSPTNVGFVNRLFSDNFELGSTIRWNSSGGGTADAVTYRTGKYSGKVTNSASTNGLGAVIDASTTVYGRTYFNVTTLGNPTVLMGFDTAEGSGSKLYIYLGASGNLCYSRTIGATTSACSATAPSTSAWHKLETRVTVSATVGILQVYLDDTLVTTNSNAINLSSQNFGTTALDYFTLAGITSSTSTVYFDDVAVDTVSTGDSASLYVSDNLQVGGNSSFGTVLANNTSANGFSIEAQGGINTNGSYFIGGEEGMSSNCTGGQSLTNTQVARWSHRWRFM
jgi:parallel beta-helix repeat protein